jgi:hypothetical protein
MRVVDCFFQCELGSQRGSPACLPHHMRPRHQPAPCAAPQGATMPSAPVRCSLQRASPRPALTSGWSVCAQRAGRVPHGRSGIRSCRRTYLGANIDLLLTADGPVMWPSSSTAPDQHAVRDVQAGPAMAYQSRQALLGLTGVTTYQMGARRSISCRLSSAFFHHVRHALYGGRNDNTMVFFPASPFDPAFPDDLHGRRAIWSSKTSRSPARPREAVRSYGRSRWRAPRSRRPGLAVTANIDGQAIRFGNLRLEGRLRRRRSRRQPSSSGVRGRTLPSLRSGISLRRQPLALRPDTAAHMLRNAGWIWLRGAHSVGGYTCAGRDSHQPAPADPTARPGARALRQGGGQSTMDVLGRLPATGSFWITRPSRYGTDHAGVAATLWPARTPGPP